MKANTLKALTATVSFVALLGGCKSSPERAAYVERARSQVNALARSPQAEQAASRDLASARNSLNRAETALADRDDGDARHFAYLATQQANTGLARVGEAKAREEVARGEAERNRVLLQSREREAETAREVAAEQSQLADARARQAANARDNAQQAQADAANARQELEDLKAKQTERGMVLTLGDVLFDTAASAVKPGGMQVLDRVSAFLKEHDQVRVMVEGHTDSRGSDDYNQHLSEQRAQSVAQTLEQQGVDADRLEPIGRGETTPIAGNDTAAGQQLNRRVELVFSDFKGQFASGTASARQF